MLKYWNIKIAFANWNQELVRHFEWTGDAKTVKTQLVPWAFGLWNWKNFCGTIKLSSRGLRSSVWIALKLLFWKLLKSTLSALRRWIHYGGIAHLVSEHKSICCFSNQILLPQQTSHFWKPRLRFLQIFNPLKLVKFLICNALKLGKIILMTKKCYRTPSWNQLWPNNKNFISLFKNFKALDISSSCFSYLVCFSME